MSGEESTTHSMNKNHANEGHANSSTSRTQGLWPILICAAISAEALFFSKFAVTPLSVLNEPSKASKTERETQILTKNAKACTAITNVTHDAEQALQEAQQRMEAKIDAAGSSSFQREAYAGELAEKCASIQNIAKILYLLARDRAGIPAKETPEGFIQDLIAPEMQKFLAPSVDEVQQTVAEYQKFGVTIDQSRAAKLKSELAELQRPATEFPIVKDDYRLAFKELILNQLNESEQQIKEGGKQAIRTTHQEWTAAWKASSERLSFAWVLKARRDKVLTRTTAALETHVSGENDPRVMQSAREAGSASEN